MLRVVPPELGGQSEEHVHLHRLHPHRHEDDPGLLRGTGRPGSHGPGHQPGGKQEKRTGKALTVFMCLKRGGNSLMTSQKLYLSYCLLSDFLSIFVFFLPHSCPHSKFLPFLSTSTCVFPFFNVMASSGLYSLIYNTTHSP